MESLRNSEDAPDVVTAFRYLRTNKTYTDFYFISGDGREEHHVHRLVLACQSHALSKIVFGESPCDFIQVKNDDNLALRNMIRYLYNEELILESIYDVRNTKTIADRYELKNLSEICKRRLVNVPVDVDNVLAVLELAKEYQNEDKERECLEIIGKYQETIFKSTEFLRLTFRRVLEILEKLKKMSMLTEAVLLRLAINWLDKNSTASENNKQLLSSKVNWSSLSLDDYLAIVMDFPDFYNGGEISDTLKIIKSNQKFQEVPKKEQENNIKSGRDIGKNTETLRNAEKFQEVPKKEQENNIKSDRDIGKNTEALRNAENLKKESNNRGSSTDQLLADVNFFKKELSTSLTTIQKLEERCDLLTKKNNAKSQEIERLSNEIKELKEAIKKHEEANEITSPMSSLVIDSKQKVLSIQILNEDDGVNVFDIRKRARITVQEGKTIRSVQVAVDDVLKTGLIGTVAEKKGSFSESDIDISYEGVYFMLRSLQELDETLSPVQYIEVLKAALHFQIKALAEKCIKRINGIMNYDPLFLDGLRSLSYLKDKCLGLKGLAEFKDKYVTLLLSEPLRVILHPNFTKCSVDLIILLLQQAELKVKDESQLLLVVIAWLEARKEERRIFRNTLLKHIAFESISITDFRYATSHYPNFFDENEEKLILASRNATSSQLNSCREKLPEWYSFSTRKHI